MFINTIARVYSAVQYVISNMAVISQCKANLDGLVRDYDTFAHVTSHPVVVSDYYCAVFASAVLEYIVISSNMYSMYLRGENTDVIDAIIKHEDGHHSLGHLNMSMVALVTTAMDSEASIQREYEADEYSHNAGYPMLGALGHLRSECIGIYGADHELISLLSARIERLESLVN